MISTTSFSNRNNFTSLCKNLLKRNLGAMVYLTVLGFVFYPLQFILTAYSDRFDVSMQYAKSLDVFAKTVGGHTAVSLVFFTMIMLIAPVVVGLNQMSYLHSKRSVDVYHSLPVTRDSLMAANFCVGFVTVMLPALINYLATIGAGALKAASTIYTFNPLPIITDFGIWSIIVLAILAIISFVAVQVGSVFDNFVFAGEFILAPAAVLLLAVVILDEFLLGFSLSNISVENLSLYSPVSLVIIRYAMGSDSSNELFMRNSNIALIIWLGIALLLFSCAMLIYRKRKSELAEKNISASPIAQVGKLIAVYLGGILIGLMFYSIFSSNETYNFPLWSVLGAALVYVLSEVILLRGFKGLSKSLVPGVVSAALVGIFAFAAVGGGFGYVNKMPAASSVESVTINYRGRYSDINQIKGSTKRLREQTWWEDGERKTSAYYDYDYYKDVTLTSPEAIALVQEYHKAILEYSKAPKEERRNYTYMNHTISYAVKGGKKLVRTYVLYHEIPEQAKAILAKLEGTEEFKRKTHPVFNSTAEDYSSMVVTDAFGIKSGTRITDPDKIAQVLQALADDMLDEDINRVMSGEAKVLGYIDFALAKPPIDTGVETDDFLSNYVIITEDYKRTVGLLRSMGQEELLTPDTAEITQVGVTTNLYGSFGESVILKVPYKEYLLDREGINQKFYGQPDYTSDDPAMISRLADLSFAQIYPKDSSEKILSVVFYGQDGKEGFARYIQFSKLPQEVVNSLPEWYMDEVYDEKMIEIAVG